MYSTAMRDERLDLYLDQKNIERARAVQDSFKFTQNNNDSSLPKVDLDVIVLNLNSFELVTQIINGAKKVIEEFKAKGFKVRFLIGDTGSTDPKVIALYEKLDVQDIVIIQNLIYNFSSCNNELAYLGNSDFKLFLNNDVLIENNPGAIFKSFETIQLDESIAIVGLNLDFPNKTIQHAGIEFLTEPVVRGLPYHPSAKEIAQHKLGSIRNFNATTGAYLLIRSKNFFQVGGFNEFYVAECQDVELCLAVIRQGHKCVVLDAGELVHIENYTRPKGEENWVDRRYFLRRWSSFIETLIA